LGGDEKEGHDLKGLAGGDYVKTKRKKRGIGLQMDFLLAKGKGILKGYAGGVINFGPKVEHRGKRIDWGGGAAFESRERQITRSLLGGSCARRHRVELWCCGGGDITVGKVRFYVWGVDLGGRDWARKSKLNAQRNSRKFFREGLQKKIQRDEQGYKDESEKGNRRDMRGGTHKGGGEEGR